MDIHDFFIEQAYSKETSPETLNALSKNEDPYIRKIVAMNRNTPACFSYGSKYWSKVGFTIKPKYS